MKIPEPNIPTESEMKNIANEWWKNHVGINFHDWNQVLRSHTFDYKIVKLNKELIQKTIDMSDTGGDQLPELIKEYSKLIDPVLNSINSDTGYFVKLITRSPKDYLADIHNHGKPSEVKTSKEIVNSILCSMRCFEDLVLLKYLDQAALVIRPYIKFSPADEWRVFVKDKKIVGITQYYYESHFPIIREYIILIEHQIRNFVTEIVVPNLDLNDFVADIVTSPDDRPMLLELNPYGLSDPCLFVSYSRLDGSIKYNQG